MTHGHRDFTVCSCSSLPVLLPGESSTSTALKCSDTAVISGDPVMRSARTNACRRIAASRHACSGCSQAPRPGSVLATSTVTAQLPFPPPTATTRSSSTASSRLRQPTHVRTGPSGRRCAEAEVSRWITTESTVTLLAKRNGLPGGPARAHVPAGTSGRGRRRAPHRGWVGGRHRCGCRSASRSAARPTGRFGPPCRSPATAENRAPPRGRPGRTRR
jgi:hypothetical protein